MIVRVFGEAVCETVLMAWKMYVSSINITRTKMKAPEGERMKKCLKVMAEPGKGSKININQLLRSFSRGNIVERKLCLFIRGRPFNEFVELLIDRFEGSHISKMTVLIHESIDQ